MLAGAVLGMCEHIAMYPINTIKTRMQTWSTGTLFNYFSEVLAAC